MTEDERRQLEEQLSAYLDGELDDEARAEVAEHLARSPEAREALEQLRQVTSLVGKLPRGQAPEDLGESILGRLEREQLFAGSNEMPSAPATPPGALSLGRLVAAAAVILVPLLAGYLAIEAVWESRQHPVQVADADDARPKLEDDGVEEEDLEKARTNGNKEVRGLAKSKAPTRTHKPSAPRPEPDSEAEGRKDAPLAKRPAAAPAYKRSFKKRAPEPPKPTPRLAKGAPAPKEPKAPAAKARPAPAKTKAAPGRAAGRKPALAEAEGLVRTEAKPAAPARTRGRRHLGKRVPGKPVGQLEKADEARVARVDRAPVRLPVPSTAPRPSWSAGETSPPAGLMVDRLRAGTTVDELTSLSFGSEPVQLVLTTTDSNKQARTAWALQAFFARNAIQDARLLSRSAKLHTATSFYVSDRRPEKEQPKAPPADRFLLRGTPAQVASLVDELGRSLQEDVKVALATPAVRAEGWQKANVVAQTLKTDAVDEGRRGQAAYPRAMAKAAPRTKPSAPLGKAGAPRRGKRSGGETTALADASSMRSQRGKKAEAPRTSVARGRPAEKAGKVSSKAAGDRTRSEWLGRDRGRAAPGRLAGQQTASVEPMGPPSYELGATSAPAAPPQQRARRSPVAKAPSRMATQRKVAAADPAQTQEKLRTLGYVATPTQTQRAARVGPTQQLKAGQAARFRPTTRGQAKPATTLRVATAPSPRPTSRPHGGVVVRRLRQQQSGPALGQQSERVLATQPRLLTVVITVKTAVPAVEQTKPAQQDLP